MRQHEHRRGTADGFSMVELIIAMFLLAVIALALLPLLVGVTRTSSTNKSLVAATSLANAQVSAIRTLYPNDSTTSTCTALAQSIVKLKTGADATGITLASSQPLISGIPGPTGSGLSAKVTTSGCPSTLPGTVAMTVAVTDKGGHTLVSLPTLIVVNAT
ncbi:prepilin-type N-terminal cleavage/methylation domain-containing protein [Microbacterium elymi]|uniref:Prepilin-type N-terminal cleavage/methylation domain-containing protein n=2 Tax=Microbacterium elymi TaxID=2909587 RepID=A0ABY5NNK8_9MICO|nr:prepilin-type N-terminal cleavage/methylation domain-containing protein [Microbacterium elymi]